MGVRAAADDGVAAGFEECGGREDQEGEEVGHRFTGVAGRLRA